MLHLLVTGASVMSWLAVKTSDVPYALKLASGNSTSWVAGDTVSRLESSWGGPAYTAATFPATISSHCESLVQTGFKRESDNEWNKMWAGAKTGRGGCSWVTELLAWFPDVAYLSFKRNSIFKVWLSKLNLLYLFITILIISTVLKESYYSHFQVFHFDLWLL